MTHSLRRGFIFLCAALALVAIGASDAFAAGRYGRGGLSGLGGPSALEFGISLVTANQKGINAIIDRTGDAYPGSYSVKDIGTGMEIFAQYGFGFSGTMYSLLFRPSYFMQSTSGKCGAGDCEHKLTGITFFPILRLTPLENDFIKFFMQTGVGYGHLSVDAKEGGSGASATYSGDAFGGMVGIGADFCFTATHCLTIEGNLRYLPIERNLASSSSGAFNGYSQIGKDQEVEYNGKDLATTLSGIQGVVAYTLNF